MSKERIDGDLEVTGTISGTLAGSVSTSSLALTWDFDTNTTIADPGSGNMRFNNAAPGSVGRIALSDLNADGNSVGVIPVAFNKQDFVLFVQADDSTKYAYYQITNDPPTQFGFTELVVTGVGAGTLFDNGSRITMIHSATMNIGSYPLVTAAAADVVLIEDADNGFTRSRVTAADFLDKTPDAHAASHENGGADEISVAGLSGLLGDAQTPTSHAASHSDGGTDEITVENLATSGGLGTVPTSDGLGGLTMQTPAGGGGTPAGADHDIQFNNTGAFGAATLFKFDDGPRSVTFGLQTGTNLNVGVNNTPTGSGGLSHGSIVSGTGNEYFNSSGNGAVARGALTNNEAVGGGTSYIKSTGSGSVAAGGIVIANTGAGHYAKIQAEGSGSISTGGITNRQAVIRSYGDGCITAGRAIGTGTGGIYSTSGSNGTLAVGHVNGSGKVQTGGNGAWAGGDVAPGNYIKAYAAGALAHGSATSGDLDAQGPGSHVFGATANGSTMTAYGTGAVCFGSTVDGSMSASGEGSACIGSGDLTAYSKGSLALGSGANGKVYAGAVGAVQVAYGYNTQPHSLAVGSYLRFTANPSGPSSKRNGDIWCDSQTVYIRSFGADVRLNGTNADGVTTGYALTDVNVVNGIVYQATSTAVVDGVYTGSFISGLTLKDGLVSGVSTYSYGFTGSGAFTSFTFTNGICTSAS
jgi:hypothetical protein